MPQGGRTGRWDGRGCDDGRVIETRVSGTNQGGRRRRAFPVRGNKNWAASILLPTRDRPMALQSPPAYPERATGIGTRPPRGLGRRITR
jgi:hypothetical protein